MTLLGVLDFGADLRMYLSTLPEVDLDSEDNEKEVAARFREVFLNSRASELQELVLTLLESGDECEAAGLVDFEWKLLIAREINLVEKDIYAVARSARDSVIAKARLSLSAPTDTEQKIQAGLDHIAALLDSGKELGWFVQTYLGGKAYPLGRKLLEPIFGISRPSWETEFFPKEE